ncbi:LutC/YkgG family protein [Planococcus halotolerans]|uniref:Lactate utilization protein C n=1 Tax=Planococcus halotolerans TaxID=2233542 RepID=A0A365L7R4_9BACL|nr:lactate utilization protein C [Planococcus halotolerans]RAZ81151.1 lactate utilization protein C [Planococcus halotolerans]
MTAGTIHNKEQFLNRITSQLGRDRNRQVGLPEWQHRPQLDVFSGASVNELAAAFKKNSLEKSTFVVNTDKANLAEALQEVIMKYGGGQVVASKDARFGEFGLDAVLDNEKTHIWDTNRGQENIEIAKKANIGLFISDAALAESGTIVQFNDKDIARSISLLPTVYVAIVPKSTIVPRMTQVVQAVHQSVEEGNNLATCINFISGPSNSADIEMNIVIGVHGPVEAVHVIVEDL